MRNKLFITILIFSISGCNQREKSYERLKDANKFELLNNMFDKEYAKYCHYVSKFSRATTGDKGKLYLDSMNMSNYALKAIFLEMSNN